MRQVIALAVALNAATFVHAQDTETESYKGLQIAPENRCAEYDRDDYSYPQTIELDIIEALGGIYGPYTGTCFSDRSETDIEHIVATAEAHDSGLCSADAETKKSFATDLLNLTLAAPNVNRYEKSDNDVAEWTPTLNVCWYAQRTIDVRLKYGLTIDNLEALAVDAILTGCESTEMIYTECTRSFFVEERVSEQESITLELAKAWKAQLELNSTVLSEILTECQARTDADCSTIQGLVTSNTADVTKAQELIERAQAAAPKEEEQDDGQDDQEDPAPALNW